MYNCGVRFGEIVGFPVRALLISPSIESEETSLEEAQEALAHCVGVVLNYMID
jgi:translation elongation factor EF-1beta